MGPVGMMNIIFHSQPSRSIKDCGSLKKLEGGWDEGEREGTLICNVIEVTKQLNQLSQLSLWTWIHKPLRCWPPLISPIIPSLYISQYSDNDPILIILALYTTIWTPRDFADHFRCKIDTIRPKLLPDHNMFNNTTDPLEMEMESFVKVDTEMLGTVFSQVKQPAF